MLNEAELLAIAAIIGATPADIPGLWNAPGYPELTTAQMIQAARQAEVVGEIVAWLREEARGPYFADLIEAKFGKTNAPD